MKYRAIFERAADGRWLADIPEVPGCSVSGHTIAEARARVRKALSV
jgi:predicted RNase H-like HicB family nuclease